VEREVRRKPQGLISTGGEQEAKADLRAYEKWAQHEAVMGADARKRKSGFFAWLEAEDPAGVGPR
jgi:hypothetical protein